MLRKKERKVDLLGENIVNYLDANEKKWAKKSAVMAGWELVVPVELRKKCQPKDYIDGILEIDAQPGPVFHKLCQMRNQLLKKIRKHRQCQTVTQIKIKPASFKQEKNE